MPDEGFDLRRALEDLRSTGRLSTAVRPEIVASWRRSVASELRPDRYDVPFEPRPRPDHRLEPAARPVLDRLLEDLAPASMALVLSDPHGAIVERLVREPWLAVRLDSVKVAPGYCHDEGRVGTNAIGTALVERAPSTVIGDEHFADALTEMASAAAPILDPADSSVAGAVGLTCPAVGSHALMLTVAKRAARDIEQRLAGAGSPADQALLDSFVTARRGARGALVALNGRAMYTNAPAVRLVADIDRAVLWGLVSSALADHERAEVELPLPRGESSLLSCEAVGHGVAVAGALLRVVPQSEVGPGTPLVPDRRRGATMGWESLTETERGIAALVSEGRTNRQIAAATFLSPHTVGYHLRHIFYKLGVSSRVELTRLVVQRSQLG